MAPTIKNSVSEIARAVVIAGILTAGSAVVLASRIDERVKAHREYANQADASERELRIQKDSELERNLVLMQSAQKEVVAIMSGLARDNANFREEAIRRLTTLDERMGYLVKNIEDIRKGRDK